MKVAGGIWAADLTTISPLFLAFKYISRNIHRKQNMQENIFLESLIFIR